MRLLDSSGVIDGVESVAVAAAAAYELDPEAVLIAVRRDFISAYCIVVVAANWSRDAPLFVAEAERLLEWPSNWAIVSSVEAGPRPVVGWLGDVAVIPWAAIARLVDKNESPRWEEAHICLSIALFRGTNLSFQAVQVWAEGTRFSQSGRSLGKEFSERRSEVAMATNQSSVIGREARLAFFCA